MIFMIVVVEVVVEGCVIALSILLVSPALLPPLGAER